MPLCHLLASKPTDQTNKWPAGRWIIHVHTRRLLSFCLCPLGWERIQRFYQLWGYLCSLQLCCALNAGDKDSPALLARKAEYHQMKIVEVTLIWGEKTICQMPLILTPFMQILIALSAFLWLVDGESFRPQPVSYRKTHTHSPERESKPRGNALGEAVHIDSCSWICSRSHGFLSVCLRNKLVMDL